MAKNPTTMEILRRLTKNTNKHGEIKGKNKKDTKRLRATCLHHKVNKHNKPKATIFSNDGEFCNCLMCKASFPAKFYSNQEISERLDDMIEMNEQCKYIAVATGAGDDIVNYYVQLNVLLSSYKKNTKKLRDIAEKQDRVGKKKKHNRGGSSAYGSWSQK